ncbi:MAG: hypothetical protein LBQ54_01850 [Planctomycetaceae bacterium]|jgi:hypothetical protein|nr:hypothetical protein [Planctomycetaceae bacterium]
MTLRELYKNHYLPVLIKNKRSPKTIQGYENTLKHWEQAFQTAETFARRGSRTEPDVVEITTSCYARLG